MCVSMAFTGLNFSTQNYIINLLYTTVVISGLYSLICWIFSQHLLQGLHKHLLILCLLWDCLYPSWIVLHFLNTLVLHYQTSTHTSLVYSCLKLIDRSSLIQFNQCYFSFFHSIANNSLRSILLQSSTIALKRVNVFINLIVLHVHGEN